MLPCPQEPFLLSMYSKVTLETMWELKLKNTVEQENGHFVTPQYMLRTDLWMAEVQPEGSMGAQVSTRTQEPIYFLLLGVDLFL